MTSCDILTLSKEFVILKDTSVIRMGKVSVAIE